MDEEQLDITAESLINSSFKNVDVNLRNTITPVHKEINFFYNSLNISLGGQGCGKTTFLMRELIKLGLLKGQHLYSQILYISSGDEDATFLALKHHVSIPIYPINYTDAEEVLQNFLDTRTDIVEHTFLILEDSTFILTKDNSCWNNWFCKLRHLRWTVWLNVHVWRSVNTMLKSQVTCLFIFKGYSREVLQMVHRQTCINVDFLSFWSVYTYIKNRQCLMINNTKQKIKII